MAFLRRYAVSIGLLVICAGCADLTTISRRTDLPDTGKAIHLDAQQRLFYANKNGQVCAEASPDAIQAIAASLGASVAIPSQGAGSISQAISQSTGSIGLRTQSITLMRDALYRICEESYNKMLSPTDVVQLLERAQDVTVGVLAIEQLTGAVVARQVILAGSAQSSASADLANTAQQLDSAKRIEAQKKQALDDAQKQLDADNAQLKADQAVNPPTDASKKDSDDLTTNKIPADTKKRDAAKDEYQRAQDVTQTIQNNFNAASTAATAAASGSGSFSDNGTAPSGKIDKDTAATISTAVDDIVQKVIYKGHLTDACINFLAEFPNLTNPPDTAKQTFDLCQKVIETDLQIIRAGGGPGPAIRGTPAPSLLKEQLL